VSGQFTLHAANALRVKVDGNVHYITLPTIYSGLSKNNFKDYTVFQKKTSTHIIGYKLKNSCLILIIFDTKMPHIM